MANQQNALEIRNPSAAFHALQHELAELREEMIALERRFFDENGSLNGRSESARNLLHYLALRRRDLRPLQLELAARGLSSLGRAEAHVLASLEAVLAILRRLSGPPEGAGETLPSAVGGRQVLEAHTLALLGPAPAGRDVRIMVTMPSEAADDYALVRDLVAAGMNCMRINTAHDTRPVWERMVRNLDRAREETRRPCRLLIDLAGPKLRTGPIESDNALVKWRPQRDGYGRVCRPARIWLSGRDRLTDPPQAAAGMLPVADDWLAQLSVGDLIKFFDTRHSMRRLVVVARDDGGVWAESNQTAYVIDGTTLHVSRASSKDSPPLISETVVGPLPRRPTSIHLSAGDTLVLRRTVTAGHAARRNQTGEVVEPATIGVTLPDIFDHVRPGEAIWFDDGRIGGVMADSTVDRIVVTITHVPAGRGSLAADKGINLPDSDLRLPALTTKDLEDLPFIAAHADLVGYSFVRSAANVRELQQRLAEMGGRGLGLILKIETRRAFDQLPALLLAAMDSPSSGVMIARGDLAIECGYERLAEVQEEILWLAEASHTPVVWATQVLERLAKDGTPSRAEITDAAMGERAECVMLNKGPYIVDAVRVLDDILRRMESHQQKKTAMLRHLGLADRFSPSA
jgi:pyruvate kinase